MAALAVRIILRFVVLCLSPQAGAGLGVEPEAAGSALGRHASVCGRLTCARACRAGAAPRLPPHLPAEGLGKRAHSVRASSSSRCPQGVPAWLPTPRRARCPRAGGALCRLGGTVAARPLLAGGTRAAGRCAAGVAAGPCHAASPARWLHPSVLGPALPRHKGGPLNAALVCVCVCGGGGGDAGASAAHAPATVQALPAARPAQPPAHAPRPAPAAQAAQASLLCKAAAAFLRQQPALRLVPEAELAAAMPTVIAGDFNSLPRKAHSDAFDTGGQRPRFGGRDAKACTQRGTCPGGSSLLPCPQPRNARNACTLTHTCNAVAPPLKRSPRFIL